MVQKNRSGKESKMPSDAGAAMWKALCMEQDAHPRRTGRKPRIKASERIREMLFDLGVTPDLIWWNKGYWSHATQDCYRWEFTGSKDGITCTGGSYDSMTTCAKPGMKLVWVKD